LVVDENLTPELQRMAKAHRPKGSDKPLFNRDTPWPFQPGFEINSKQFKRIETDELLRKLMDKECKPGYAKLLVDLEAKIKAFAATCPKDGAKDEDLEKLGKTITDALAAGAKDILDGAKKPLETYLKDRTLGKVEQQKYEMKKAKGIFKMTLGAAAIGGAIAGAIASFGASSPTILVAFYGTYKAMRETQQTFKNAARSVDDYAESIEKTFDELKVKYESLPVEDQATAIAAGETKNKVLRELIGFTGQSIKKLEESLTGYDKAVEIAFYCQSRLGKQVSELNADLVKVSAKLQELDQLPKPVDPKTTAKIKKVTAAQATIKKEAKELLEAAEKSYGELLVAKTRSEPWWKAQKDLKAKRPDWVRHITKPLKFAGIAAAAASQDFTEVADEGAMALFEIGGELAGAVALYVEENKKDMKKKKK
jgi:hypothetical protein